MDRPLSKKYKRSQGNLYSQSCSLLSLKGQIRHIQYSFRRDMFSETSFFGGNSLTAPVKYNICKNTQPRTAEIVFFSLSWNLIDPHRHFSEVPSSQTFLYPQVEKQKTTH